jgi:hypothetical protein
MERSETRVAAEAVGKELFAVQKRPETRNLKHFISLET